MPFKNKICGVYEIVTPNGSKYIGSSSNIKSRWEGHKSELRHNKHHSLRLSNAYKKHGESLIYNVLCECDINDLSKKEQEYINLMKPTLNMSQFVENNWADPEVRKKRQAILSSDWYRKKLSESLKRPNTHWRKVDCSNGVTYESLTRAGKAFGVEASFIRHLAATKQYSPKLKVKFKYPEESWAEDVNPENRIWAARRKNKTDKHSKKTIEKLKKAKVGYKPSKKTIDAARESVSTPVVGICTITGEVVEYGSIREAAIKHKKTTLSAAETSIARSTRTNRTAYGYKWEKKGL